MIRMLQSMTLVIVILFINAFFYSTYGQEIDFSQGIIFKEAFLSLYKIVVYLCPVLICLKWRDSRAENHILQLKQQFGWFSERGVYWIWVLWVVLLLVGKQTIGVHYGTYGFFYVLVVNSLVEETVFRGYIQSRLIDRFGNWPGIIGQALLFGVVHIPLYTLYYVHGVYSQLATLAGGFIPEAWVGIVLVLIALCTPITLGLVRGCITKKTNSLRPSIIRHSLHNCIVLFL